MKYVEDPEGSLGRERLEAHEAPGRGQEESDTAGLTCYPHPEADTFLSHCSFCSRQRLTWLYATLSEQLVSEPFMPMVMRGHEMLFRHFCDFRICAFS